MWRKEEKPLLRIMPRNRNAKTNNKILRKDIDNLKTMDFLNKEESIRTPKVRKRTKIDNHKLVIIY